MGSFQEFSLFWNFKDWESIPLIVSSEEFLPFKAILLTSLAQRNFYLGEWGVQTSIQPWENNDVFPFWTYTKEKMLISRLQAFYCIIWLKQGKTYTWKYKESDDDTCQTFTSSVKHSVTLHY